MAQPHITQRHPALDRLWEDVCQEWQIDSKHSAYEQARQVFYERMSGDAGQEYLKYRDRPEEAPAIRSAKHRRDAVLDTHGSSEFDKLASRFAAHLDAGHQWLPEPHDRVSVDDGFPRAQLVHVDAVQSFSERFNTGRNMLGLRDELEAIIAHNPQSGSPEALGGALAIINNLLQQVPDFEELDKRYRKELAKDQEAQQSLRTTKTQYEDHEFRTEHRDYANHRHLEFHPESMQPNHALNDARRAISEPVARMVEEMRNSAEQQRTDAQSGLEEAQKQLNMPYMIARSAARAVLDDSHAAAMQQERRDTAQRVLERLKARKQSSQQTGNQR